MDNASWILSEKSEVLSWETWNPQKHVFFIDTQLWKKGSGESFLSVYKVAPYSALSKSDRGHRSCCGEHRFRTEECC